MSNYLLQKEVKILLQKGRNKILQGNNNEGSMDNQNLDHTSGKEHPLLGCALQKSYETGCKRKSTQKNFIKLTSTVLAIAMTIQLLPATSFAWLQKAHMEINRKATENFENTSAKTDKYKNATIDFGTKIEAPHVTSAGKTSYTHNQEWQTNPALEHIIHGGYSADEPHAYVSVKHFYDPLKLSGKYELTDQYALHGWHVYELIPANDWGITRTGNPYCLVNAMLNYKDALETYCDATPGPLNNKGDFRDLAAAPKDLAEERSMYTGKAMRGLGEVMHMVADMTQPAHVRNDSHPFYEVTETAIASSALAASLVNRPRVDDVSIDGFGPDVNKIMEGLAKWTNSNFYSEDTLYDSVLGIKPKNWEYPYPSPQLSNMTKKVLDGHFTWVKTFGNTEVPMVRSHMGLFYDSYEITSSFATKQAEVLLPLAVDATKKTMDLFFPTLELKQTVTEEEADADILKEAKEKGAEDLKQFKFDATMTHLTDKDPQWKAFGFTIRYSGPGEIWNVRNNKHKKLCDVEYKEGKIVRYEDPETGEMTNGTPTFWMPIGASKKISVGGTAVDYSVEMDDALYCVINGGVQTFKSDPYIFERLETKIELNADRTTIMPGEKVDFNVKIENAPERYQIEWTFGDETDTEGKVIKPVLNKKLKMSHTYKNEKEYTATVRLIDLKRKIVRAQDTIQISSYLGEMAGMWNITMEVQEENKFFKSLIVSFMKILINFIISPIAEAITGEPIDPASVDNFTFVGTTMNYTVDLRKTDETATVYEGPFIFVGSNTGYLEASESVKSLRLETKDGKIIFTAIGVDDNGKTVEFEYLKDGKMVSPGRLEGEFNIPGAMSGRWTATK